MQKSVYIVTFGCQMNDSDSERLLSFLSPAYQPTREAALADLIILNTCSVRDKAEQKVYSAAGKFKELKEKKKDLIFAICGCVAQQEGERLLKRIAHLDLVFGPDSIHRALSMIRKVEKKRARIFDTTQTSEIARGEYAPATPLKRGVKALVNIMRGCNNFCSYCIVPFTRGREVSRDFSEIIEEISTLSKAGVREVTLLGQNVNSFTTHNGTRSSFPDLLRSVCGVEKIERVRFITSHPKDISDELIALFGEQDKLARHIHLPVQSGSDRVLERMNRGYSSTEYLEKVLKLKTLYPELSITTDIIVGFPGETEGDFNATLELIDQVRFDSIFSFKYSPRPETSAASFAGQVSEDDKSARLRALQERQALITREKSLELVGTTAKVLVEGRSVKSEEELTGRSSINRVINFPGAPGLVGEIIDVSITRALPNSLRGVCTERSLN